MTYNYILAINIIIQGILTHEIWQPIFKNYTEYCYRLKNVNVPLFKFLFLFPQPEFNP